MKRTVTILIIIPNTVKAAEATPSTINTIARIKKSAGCNDAPAVAEGVEGGEGGEQPLSSPPAGGEIPTRRALRIG